MLPISNTGRVKFSDTTLICVCNNGMHPQNLIIVGLYKLRRATQFQSSSSSYDNGADRLNSEQYRTAKLS